MNNKLKAQRAAPAPTVMPVDRQLWRAQLDLSNFVNTYYQYRDLQSLGTLRTVLIVGPGQGLEALVLKWRGYDVTTLDIDPAFEPDVLGSVHDMRVFDTGRFDAVIASHVLEHLAIDYFEPAVGEIARVGSHALIYLPVHGRHCQVRVVPGVAALDLSVIMDFYNYLDRPSGTEPRYMRGQHFWEVGMRGFRVAQLRRRMSPFFHVLRDYRNRDWLPSHNFVLRSKRAGH